MEIITKINLTNNINLFEQITFDIDILLNKIYTNKLKKADRELIAEYLGLLYEFRVNKE